MSFVKDFIKSKKINQTVFGFSDLSSAVTGYTGPKLRSALKYAVQKGDLYRISKGMYSLSKEYSKMEFANKFRSPSYISLYTVLQKAAVVFQPYSSIYCVSNRSQVSEIDSQIYIYRKIKNQLLLNPFGITNEDNTQIATVERALCDTLYLYGDAYFDNVRNINWNMMSTLNNQVYGGNKSIAGYINKHNT